MGKLIELFNLDRRLLWVDATEYAGALLARGQIPWCEATEFLAWFQKAQALLRSDVIAVPLAPMVKAWTDMNAALRRQMQSKPRITWPLKVVLGCEPLREHIRTVLNGNGEAYRDQPIALVIPSPRAWLIQTAGVDSDVREVGPDEIDAASLYVADFLRSFGDSRIDVLLLEEQDDAKGESQEILIWYAPLLNVAHHFRWDAGIRLHQEDDCNVSNFGFDFSIATKALSVGNSGISLGESFLVEGQVPTVGSFFHWKIPTHAKPEHVLERIAALRGCK